MDTAEQEKFEMDQNIIKNETKDSISGTPVTFTKRPTDVDTPESKLKKRKLEKEHVI
jgi:hypothetical protein